MRFRKGSKVEVFSQTEVPSGSWICAKILSGNGHNYDIMYDCSPGVGSTAVVDRVSRKVIRPCPPPVETVKDWVVSDIVEMFDNVSWKMATVSKVMSGGYFLVRLLGSDREFKAHKSDLRVRQSWKDDEWVVVGKGFGNFKDAKYNKLSTLKSYQQSNTHFPIGDRKMKVHGGDKRFHVEGSAGFQDCHMAYSRNLKRGPSYNLSYAEPYVGAAHKVRAIEEAGRRQRIVPMRISLLTKKGQSWRLVLLASKGQKMMVGFATFLLVKTMGGISAPNSLQIRC